MLPSEETCGAGPQPPLVTHLLASPIHPVPHFCHSGLVTIHPTPDPLILCVVRGQSQRRGSGEDAGERENDRGKEAQGSRTVEAGRTE